MFRHIIKKEDVSDSNSNQQGLFRNLLNGPVTVGDVLISRCTRSPSVSNGSLHGPLGVTSFTSNSINGSQPCLGANMGMRPTMMNQMGSMANPNQNITLVNALAGKAPGQMCNMRGPTPSSTPTNSISDPSIMTSMGGPVPMNQQGSF